MYTIKLMHGGKTIAERKIDGSRVNGLHDLIKVYQEEFGIEIGGYSLSQSFVLKNECQITITDEDLEARRNDRLGDIID